MNKREHVSALAAVTLDHASWHSSEGWFCDRCGTECGASPVDLCSCCVDALTSLPEALLGGSGAVGETP